MKKILLVLSVFLGFSLSAQITLTNADFMGASDSIFYTTGDDFSIDPTPAGPNQTWDYSSLNGVSQKIVTHYPMSAAGFSYQFTFQNAEFFTDNIDMPIDPSQFGQFLPIQIENMVGFFLLDQNEMTNLGYGADISSFPVPMQMDTVDTWYEFPINYGDTWGGPFYFKLDMNPVQDLIYLTHSDRTTEVTGWGNLTTPYGNYDCLKLKHIVVAEDSVRIDLGFGAMWLPIPARTTTEYQWIPLGENGPVMVVKEDATLGVTDVYYKDAYNPTLAIEENKEKSANITIFPNPTKDFVEIKTELEVRRAFVYDMTGKLVKTFGEETKLDVTDLQKGNYILHIQCKEGMLTQEFIKE